MGEKLKVYFIGYGGNSWMAEDLRPVIEELGMILTTIHEHDNADIKWDRYTWLDHLKKADIIISPANYKKQPAKSANRLVQALSIGKPVICSPLPAYLDVAKKYPGSFLIADTPEEWKECLALLKNTPSFREHLNKRALIAAQDYSIDAIGNKWLKLLEEIKPMTEEIKDTVDIIIPTYNNTEYLKLCLESIHRNTKIPFNIIISDAGSNEDTWEYYKGLKKITVIGEIHKRKNYSEACNAGIEKSSSEYFVILNSDVIVSENWLNNMLHKMKTVPSLAACGVLSNCDRGWLF